MSAATHIPFFDRDTEHVPVSKVRYMNTAQMRELDHAILIHAIEGPVAVLVSYSSWLDLQEAIETQIGPILDRIVGK
jgi:hypothetical protein